VKMRVVTESFVEVLVNLTVVNAFVKVCKFIAGVVDVAGF
jgi:hypothetical protein